MDPSRRPLVSVIVTSYNYLHYITTAIDSVVAQTYPNVEIVVTDNRSTDGTVPALRSRYGDEPRVRIFENETNIGERANAVHGWRLARGEFVLWCSADDWLLPGHVERLVAMFERRPEIDVVHTNAFFADVAGRVWKVRQLPGQVPFDYVDARDELIDMLVTNCPLVWPAAMFRRELFDEVSLEELDPNIQCSDWELQIRIALARKRFAYLHEPSVVLRLHEQQGAGRRAYGETTRNTMDFVAMLERFIDHPGFLERLRGRELGIVALLRGLLQTANSAAKEQLFNREQMARVAIIESRLRERAAQYEPAAVRSRLLSVVLPVRQSPQAAWRAIDSVAAQTHDRWELVIVNHGPLPLGEWIRQHPAWDRISYVRTPVLLSPGRARNFGMQLARGEYLAFLDEENTFAPAHLATLVDAIAQAGTFAAATSSRCIIEHADDKLLTFEPLAELTLHRGPADSPEVSLIGAALPLDAVLFHRSLIDKVGRFDEQLLALDDFEYLLRLERAVPLAMSGAATLDVRVRAVLNNALGASLKHYVGILDTIYERHPVAATVAGKRAAHRIAVQNAIDDVVGKAVGINEIARLLAALAGRSPALAPA
jgi:glycosyltransferase involved in cell wall biosynthesis